MIHQDLEKFSKEQSSLVDLKTHEKVEQYLLNLDPIRALFESKRLHALAEEHIKTAPHLEKRPYIFMVKVATRKWIKENYERI